MFHGAVSGDCRVARAAEGRSGPSAGAVARLLTLSPFHQRIAPGSEPVTGFGVARPAMANCPPGR